MAKSVKKKPAKTQSRYLGGRSIAPTRISGRENVADLIDQTFLAYNAARLREGCRLFSEKMLEPNVTVGMSVAGALTPAGLGMSCLVPLVERGFVDWVVSTGANLYHDAHFALGYQLHCGTANIDDRLLWKDGVVRIYDIFFHYDVLLHTDAFFRQLVATEEFQHPMGTAEFHYKIGKYLDAREKQLGLKGTSFLAACYRAGVPVFTSSPGDSSMGMNIAERALFGSKMTFDPCVDVNQTAAIVLGAKRAKNGQSGVLLLGGGSPKNFVLQTEPQLREVLGIDEKGHDYFFQITDARPDTGGLSGATPNEAVSWGKIDPDRLPDSVVCYTDTTLALPLLVAYASRRHAARKSRRLYEKLPKLVDAMRDEAAAQQRLVIRKRPKK